MITLPELVRKQWQSNSICMSHVVCVCIHKCILCVYVFIYLFYSSIFVDQQIFCSSYSRFDHQEAAPSTESFAGIKSAACWISFFGQCSTEPLSIPTSFLAFPSLDHPLINTHFIILTLHSHSLLSLHCFRSVAVVSGFWLSGYSVSRAMVAVPAWSCLHRLSLAFLR